MTGPVKITLRAQNDFSSLRVNVDMPASCGRDSVTQLNDHDEQWFGVNQRLVRRDFFTHWCEVNTYRLAVFTAFRKPSLLFQRKQHLRVSRSALTISAVPSGLVSDKVKKIVLSIKETSELTDPEKRYQWVCSKHHAPLFLFLLRFDILLIL